jgi:hypothetical protein
MQNNSRGHVTFYFTTTFMLSCSICTTTSSTCCAHTYASQSMSKKVSQTFQFHSPHRVLLRRSRRTTSSRTCFAHVPKRHVTTI